MANGLNYSINYACAKGNIKNNKSKGTTYEYLDTSHIHKC